MWTVLVGSCVLKASTVECRSIPSTNTLNRHLIYTRSILDWHSPSTSQLTVGWELTYFWLMYESVDSWPTIDQLLIKCVQDVDQGYWSRVLINTQPRMPLVQMIPDVYITLTQVWVLLNDCLPNMTQTVQRVPGHAKV